MELTNIREIFRNKDKFADKEVTIGGWVRSNRNSKNFGFIVVNDGTFFEPIQVVYGNGLDNYDEVGKINVGAAIIVRGTLVLTPDAKQPFEIQAAEVTVEGASTPDYPLQKKRHTFEYLRTISHLRPRTNTFEAVFRVRSLCAYAIHKFFQERDFVYVHTPLITGSDCEGAGEMFQVTTLDLNNLPMTEDGKVDLILQKPGFEKVDDFAKTLLDYIKEQGGRIHLNDKSPAEDIYDTFGVSKKTFKKGVGDLYKKRLITLHEDGIALADS